MLHSSPSARPMAVPGPLGWCWCSLLVVGAVLVRLAVRKYKLLPTVLVLCLGLQVFAIVAVPVVVLVVRWRGGIKDEEPTYRREPLSFSWVPHASTVISFSTLAVCLYIATCYFTELQLWQGSAALECLAFVLLACKLAVTKSSAGFSAQKLLLDVLRFACRFAGSLWLGRRLPRKASDSFVLSCDFTSLLLAGGLLCGTRMLGSYQAKADSLSAPALAAGALVLALLLHVDVGREFFVDCFWTWGLYLEAVAPLPQLRLAAQNGGVLDEATSHHLSAIFGSRCLSLCFWWMIRTTWQRGMSLTGWGILALGAGQLILLSHYMCFYFRALFRRGFGNGVPLVLTEG